MTEGARSDVGSDVGSDIDAARERNLAALAIAQTAIAAGDCAGAIAQLTPLVSDCAVDRPEPRALGWQLGIAWLLQGEVDQAQSVWWEVLSQGDAAQLEAWGQELAQALAHTAQQIQASPGVHHPAALERLAQAWIELAPEESAALVLLGHQLLRRGDDVGAIAHWHAALEIAPTGTLDWVAAQTALAHAHQSVGNWDEAIAHYRRLLEETPTADLHHRLGQCYTQQQHWQAAADCYHRAIALAPQWAAAWGDRGGVLLQLGEVTGAIAHWQHALTLHPDYAAAWQAESLATTLVQALVAPTSPAQPAIAAGCCAQRMGQWFDAIALFHQALTSDAQNADCYLYLSQCWVALGQPQRGIELAQRGVAIAPHHLALHLELAQQLTQVGALDAALAALQPVEQQQPDHPQLLLVLGQLWQRQWQWAQAREMYDRYLTRYPVAVEGWLNRAIAQLHLGETEGAIASLRQVYALDSNLAPTVAEQLTTAQQQGVITDLTPYQPIMPGATPDGAIASPVTRHSVHSSQSILLTPPLTLDAELHPSFRFAEQMPLPGSFVTTLPHGRVWIDPDQSSTAILTAENQLVADLSPQFPILSPDVAILPEQHWLFQTQAMPPVEPYDETIAVLGGLSNEVYFHWMLDCLPRLELLHQAGIDLAEVDRFWVSDRQPYQRELLQLVGIPSEKVLTPRRHSHVQAARLIVPSFPGTVAWMPSWVCDWLKQLVLPTGSAAQPLTRLYISRNTATARRVLNEPALLEMLAEFGFVAVSLESRSVREQAALFANAEVIVAPHGSGLTNLAFCQPGTQVVELFSPSFVYPCYWVLSNLVGARYAYGLGLQPEGAALHRLLSPYPRLDDIYVDIDQVRSLLMHGGLTR